MKKWYLSKTLWFNFLAFIAVIIQAITGATWFTPETQGMALVLINTALRLVTKDKLGIVDDMKKGVGG